MNINDWIKICSLAIKTKGRTLHLNNNTFEFRIFEFENLKKGYMVIWNINSKNAFQISRMDINEFIITKTIIIKESGILKNERNNIPSNLNFSKNSKPYQSTSTTNSS